MQRIATSLAGRSSPTHGLPWLRNTVLNRSGHFDLIIMDRPCQFWVLILANEYDFHFDSDGQHQGAA